MNTNAAVAQILLVEDNAAHVRLMLEGFKEAGVRVRVDVLRDGIAALAYLHREGEWKNAPRPDLILLDLNLPGKNGKEVLAEIKADPHMRCIPVLIVTSSKATEDILRCYELHANGCVQKPVGFEEFVNVVKALDTFWFRTATLSAPIRADA